MKTPLRFHINAAATEHFTLKECEEMKQVKERIRQAMIARLEFAIKRAVILLNDGVMPSFEEIRRHCVKVIHRDGEEWLVWKGAKKIKIRETYAKEWEKTMQGGYPAYGHCANHGRMIL